ncbi:MAG TPA: RHS repeat-associated core domain-containing protein [Luteibacter sp.]
MARRAWLALFAGQALSKEVTYYYTDPQGTVLMTTDASGNQKSNPERSPFGKQVASDQTNGPGYTGHVDDSESQLIYKQARYYDSALGRFLSMDPLPTVPANLDRFNRYQYAGNSPYNNIDPDGRDQVVSVISTTPAQDMAASNMIKRDTKDPDQTPKPEERKDATPNGAA